MFLSIPAAIFSSGIVLTIAALICTFCFSCFPVNAQSKYNFNYLQNKIQSRIDSGYYKGASVIIVKNNTTIYKITLAQIRRETEVFCCICRQMVSSCNIAAVVDEEN